MKLIYFIFFLSTTINLLSQNKLIITKVVGGLALPVDIANNGDERLFLLEKAGKIRILENGKLATTPFLDISTKVNSRGNEQGLLGICFHPNYKNNGWFYINYIDKSSPAQTIIAKYKVSSSNPNIADSNSVEILLKITQPFTNHNGGCLKFGKDGYLYIGMGDGGSSNDPNNNAQNLNIHLGKMLRIDVSKDSAYTIPDSNPYNNEANAKKEIWASGLRNPWRFSFDRLNGDLWIGDVGQGDWEEIDVEKYGGNGGLNYGWRCYEGNHEFNTSLCKAKNNYTFPIHEYFGDAAKDGCSITGGFVYRGTQNPTYYGNYIYADYCSGKIWYLSRSSDTTVQNTFAYQFTKNQISSFGEDHVGEIYFTALAEGALYKIAQNCALKIISKKIKEASCTTATDGSISFQTNDTTSLTYLWNTGQTTPTITNLATGIYYVTVTNSNCSITDSFQVPAKPDQVACLTPIFNNIVCANDSALLIACDFPASAEYLWFKNSVRLLQNAKRIAVRESGLYSLQVIDTTNCLSLPSNSIQIIVNPLPTTPILNLSKDTLIGTPGYSSYRWFRDKQFFASTITNSLKVTQGAEYCLTVVDTNHCESLKSNTVNYIPVNINSELDPTNVSILPNPFQNEFEISINSLKNKILTVEIQSLDGQTYITKTIFVNKSKISMADFNSGVYVIRLYTIDRKMYFQTRIVKL